MTSAQDRVRPVEVDRSSPVPLYFQVATRLQELIEKGEIGVGARIENEVDLAERLGVSRPTGALVSQNNKCMDVAAGSTANGAVVQLYTCNGTGAQQFTLNAAGDLVNPQSNKCVDIKDVNANDGAKLQLWDCAGTANQKWHH